MGKTASNCKATVVSLAVCVLCVSLVFLGTGCPPQPPVCTADADCDDGLFCNGAETCVNAVCQAGTDPCEEGQTCDEDNDVCVPEGCQSDEDCAEGEFCDTQTGECVVNEQVYETAEFDHDFHSGSFDCAMCHHEGAGFSTCDTCHDRDEVVGGIAVLKDAMHSPDGGCWQCHTEQNADGTRDCSVCHTGLDEL